MFSMRSLTRDPEPEPPMPCFAVRMCWCTNLKDVRRAKLAAKNSRLVNNQSQEESTERAQTVRMPVVVTTEKVGIDSGQSDSVYAVTYSYSRSRDRTKSQSEELRVSSVCCMR